MIYLYAFGVSLISGLYTSLWGAFKDCPYEDFKPKTFPRSVYFNLVIFLTLYHLPFFYDRFVPLSYIHVFFITMGIERALAEFYKGFFRTEDQEKYFVPSRISFFGKYVTSDLLRYSVGVLLVVGVFCVLFIDVKIESFWGFLIVSSSGGLAVALGGAYKDAPFEGFDFLKFLKSPGVMAFAAPVFYFLGPINLGFLILMNCGLERFTVEYYKTYILRNMSGKFRPDIHKIQKQIDTREKFHYAALIIILSVIILYVYEIRQV
ncbi:MAG: hypothetical protein GY863_00500 [bacterium]|nr:hypothetical protein [bacterium]